MKRYRRSPHLSQQQERYVIAALSVVFGVVAITRLSDRIARGYLYENSEKASIATIAEINHVRAKYGRPPIAFDERVFQLATIRVKDMTQYNYYDHVNPKTGTCADSMRSQVGLKPNEYVAENAMNFGQSLPMGNVQAQPLTDSIDPWMHSRGHRYNLLFKNHVAGAVACYNDKCVFLGLNYDRYGEGCHTAAEGHQSWDAAPVKSDEVQP